MLEPIYLPENITVEGEEENEATFAIYPYHPGYGSTLGNALRRVLISSLPGASITAVKIEGVEHEFTALDGVKEDIVALTLNLKRVRLTSESKEPVEIVLKVDGEKKATAGDFELPPEISVANPKEHIVTTTDKKAKFEMRCTVEQGRGYAAAENQAGKEQNIGTIAIDAIFSPVQRVSFKVENVRVGQATNHHKLLITIATDGTVSPKDALKQAASILADHYKMIADDFEEKLTAERPEEEPESMLMEEEEELPENTLNLLRLPSRVHNALERVGITTVEQVVELSEEQIQDIPGLGEKAVQDIIDSREDYVESAKEEEAKESEKSEDE
jgi:DNA-directed RNA polymerase subunit alpha